MDRWFEILLLLIPQLELIRRQPALVTYFSLAQGFVCITTTDNTYSENQGVEVKRHIQKLTEYRIITEDTIFKCYYHECNDLDDLTPVVKIEDFEEMILSEL